MSKELDTLRARCALAGIALHVSQDDHGRVIYIASRWAMTRTFETMAEVEAWLAGFPAINTLLPLVVPVR